MTARPDAGRTATVCIALVALLIRVLIVWRLPPGAAWDGVLYERGARAIASGLGYTTFMFEHRSSDTVPTAFYPVGYPAFAAALYAVFGARLVVLELAGAVLGSLTVAITHRIAWRLAPGRAADVAALGLAVLPGAVLFAGAPMTEPLSALLVTAAVYLCARRPDGARVRDLLVLGIVIAAATYVRPQALLLAGALPLVTPTTLGRGRWPGRIAATALVCTVTLGCLVPWTARNCASLDGCALVSTNGGSNLAIGAVARATGRYVVLDDRDGCAGVQGEVARDRCWRDVAVAAVRAAPLHWLALAATKLDHTLSYESYPLGYDIASGTLHLTTDREQSVRRIISLPWLALLAFALFALAPFGGRTRWPATGSIVLAAVVTSLIPHLVFFGGDRYHMPFAPLIAALAAGAARGLGVLVPAQRTVVAIRVI